MQFFFAIDDTLQTIVAHAGENSKTGSYCGTEIGPSLYMVKDERVYLLSASKQAHLLDRAQSGTDNAAKLVAYAIGHESEA